MTGQQLVELKTIAEKATPGPWTYRGDPADPMDDPEVLAGDQWVCSTSYDTLSTSRGDRDYHADARFIAAANPAVVLALIETVERIRLRVRVAFEGVKADTVDLSDHDQLRRDLEAMLEM